MRSIYAAAAATLALALADGGANAMPVNHSMQGVASTNVEQAQFIYGGRNYCWYDSGWHGPGFYWCGYAWRRGFGWGGGAGWHGWHGGAGFGRHGFRGGGHHGGGHSGGHGRH